MQRSVLCAAVLAVATLTSGAARADWDHGHRHGWYGRPVYYGPAPVYVAPAPVYYAPPPVYYAPPPVYYAPPALGFSLNVPGVSVGVNVPLH